jgi:PKD repeat protein
MNKNTIKKTMKNLFLTVMLFLGLIDSSIKAQFTATWTLRTDKSGVVTGPNAANATVQNMQFASNVRTTGAHNADGYATQLINYIPSSGNFFWPNTQNDSNAVIFPIRPTGGVDLQINSLHFRPRRSNSSGEHTFFLSYEANNSGIWTNMGIAQSTDTQNDTIDFVNLNTIFYSGVNYRIKLHLAAATALTTRDNRTLFLRNINIRGVTISPPSIVPTVVTGNLGVATKYDNTVTASNYTITNAGINVRPVVRSGIIYSMNALPTFVNGIATTNVATNGVGTASFNSIINNLTPATTYYVRAYALTSADTVYGSIVNFTTLPFSIPTLNTNPASNILSNKATVGGNNIDSGGYTILEKGVCFALNNNPTYTGNKTSNGLYRTNFSTIISNLTPATKYYIRAYARNQLGIGYGNLDSFTTSAPVPVITATPTIVDFGELIFNSNAPVLSYRLNANFLSPASGNIVLTASNGYTICSTYNGTYTASLPINYTGSSIINRTIYIKSRTNNYGLINGIIVHTGGGTVTPNADTVFLNTAVIQNQDTLSNAGSDFWCGFGYQEKMSQRAGNASEAKMSIYVTTGNQPARVHVELTSGGYTRVQTIPANSFFEFNNFPTGDPANNNNLGGFPDSRLYKTEVSKKSIHIYTDNGVPVNAFLHSYTDGNSAAGTMLFPSNTWNSSYTVQAFGGTSNNANPNSFFFVIANEDNTTITFKPTQPILDSVSIFNSNPTTAANTAYTAGGTYTVTLNKGEVFNAMGGFGNNNNGLDLSGTTVSTSCDKRITVFGGNGRCFVNGLNCSQSAGSDHLIQQMFPSVAWGTKYLTMPTRSSELNYFRIYVQNPAVFGPTRVWINNPTKTTPLNPATLISNLYYEFQTNQPSLIESDKPINVTQFMLTPRCVNLTTDGGPEMIMLSPIQQSIKTANVYSALGKEGGVIQTQGNGSTTGNTSSFINVIIPTNDTANFRLDANNIGDTGRGVGSIYSNGTRIRMGRAFKVHPQDNNYCFANFWVTAGTVHSLASNRGFNAIAYGMGSGESYGYNAGTAINNLSSISVTVNPNGTDTSSGSVKTVKNNLVYLQIAVPYDTTTINSIVWDAGNDATDYLPTGPQNGIINPNTSKPICVGTIVRDGRVFYIYQSPVQYTFFEEGAYKVKVTLSGTFVSDCGGTDIKFVNVIVGRDDLSIDVLRIPANDCLSKTITLQNNSVGFAGTAINTFIYDYGDGSKKDTVLSTQAGFPHPSPNSHTYPANAVYYLTLTSVNSIGGVSKDSFLVDLSFALQTSFTATRDTACVNEFINLTASSSPTAVKWFWDYGDGTPIDSFTNGNPIQRRYTTEGDKVISHWVKNSIGCPSETIKDTIHISHTPIPNFILPSGVCIPGSTSFTNTSDTGFTPSSMPYSYKWNFGTGNASDTSIDKDPIFKYTTTPPSGGYPVSLIATSKFGCSSALLVKNVTNVFAPPVPKYRVVSRVPLTNEICNTEEIQLVDSTIMPSGSISRVVIYWDTSSTRFPSLNLHLNPHIDNAPQNGVSPITPKIYKFKYPHSRLSQTVNIRVLTYSNNNCVSDTLISVRITGTPIVKFEPLKGLCVNTSPVRINYGYDSTNFFDAPPYPRLVGRPKYSGNGVNDSMFNPSVAGIGTHDVKVLFETRFPIGNGCKDSAISTIQVWALPTVNFDTSLVKCENSAIQFIDKSVAGASSGNISTWNWNFGDPTSGANNTSTLRDPFHTFTNWGKYSVSLTVASDSGCVNTLSPNRIVSINPLPKVDFVLPKGTCVNSPVAFRDLSKIADSTMQGFTHTWNFGNTGAAGNIVTGSPLPNPAYTYSATPIDSVKLIITSQFGCIDSASKRMPSGSIFAKPIAGFRANNVSVDTVKICSGIPVNFRDASDSTAATSYWVWGDNGAVVENGNPITHTYNTTNTQVFTGSYFIDDVNGCRSDAKSIIALVYALPTVTFDSSIVKCERDSVQFFDKSIPASGTGTITNWLWNFGDPISGDKQ